MSAFDEILRKHRQRIIDREKATFGELLAEYSSLQRSLKRQLADIQKIIKDKRASGDEVGRSWVYRERRLKALLDGIGIEIERFGGTVSQITTREQRAAVRIAFDQVKETVSAVAGSQSAVSSSIGTMLPTRAIENAIGLMGDGSPIFDYWAKQMAPAVVGRLREHLINAVATGMDLRQLARNLEKTGDITKTRAMAMARTEVSRIRRETTRQIYEENSDVIKGWEWVASKSPRTCAVCLALDGRVFKVSDPFPQHINCRCTLIAVIDGVDRPPRELGADWLAKQPYDVQEHILGIEGAAAYKRGEVALKDFIGWKTDKYFGTSVYKRSLINAMMNKAVEMVPPSTGVSVYYEDDAQQVLHKLLGRKISDKDVATMVGALDDSEISVQTNGVSVGFRVEHPNVLSQIRYLQRDEDGDLYLYNSEFFLHKPSTPGTGTLSFAREALKAKELGVKYIKTYADGDYDRAQDEEDPRNGYYTWARLGYNSIFSPEGRKFYESLLVKKRPIYDINDLMKTEDGREVWYKHGSRGPMVFKLDGRSKSMRTLKKYILKKLQRYGD